MARIKDTSVRDAIAAADMVEVVSQRTALRKSGARYTGRCPFHEERTPSFSVNAVDKLYFCFGCGAKGDVVTFVRETESLDFVGAIEWLADRFRVQLEYEETSPAAERAKQHRDRLHQALEQATVFFERHLWDTDAGAPVREYLASRGLGEEIAKEFRLGLSPGRGLAAKARSGGFTADELRAAGLANQRGNDYFPFRLMFPLTDARGRVIGFQARRLRDDDPLRGKYVNSPEGELFKKSNVLYGLHLARAAIAKQERAVVVEGNTDVIALRQAGFEPVVAAMGTALTEGHLRELDRLSRRVFLCFDADAAGQDATLRGMELAVGKGFDVRVVTLPPGQDPADAPQGFEERLAGAESYLHYRVRIEIERAADRAGGVGPCDARSSPGRRTRPSGRKRCAFSPTGSTCRRRRSRVSRRPAVGGPDPPSRLPGSSPQATVSSATRWRRASHMLRSAPSSRLSVQTTSTPSCTGVPGGARRGRRRGRRARRAACGARRTRRP